MRIRTATDLGAFIRERRTKLGMDQIELAKKAGTSRKWLVEVEQGKPGAEIGLILRTLKSLEISALRKKVEKCAYYAAFWKATNSVRVAASRCAFSSR
jgi:transcriptional regulator with XRE-family HTH domain